MFRISLRSFVLLIFICFAGTVHGSERVALVVGNAAYVNTTSLANPRNDAEGVAAVLEKLDFEVILGVDLDHAGFVGKVKAFTRAVRGADIALFYYAGHGLQVRSKNYLAPVDTELLDEADLEFETIRLEAIISQMERERRTNLVFLDACRDNPLTLNLAQSMGTRSLGPDRGLARVDTGVGTMVAYSTQPGNVAYDGSGRHSPFTGALINHLDAPGDDIAVILRRVRQQVLEETEGKQVPWSNSSLTGSVILRHKERDPEIARRRFELAFWESIRDADEVRYFENFLVKYPNGQFSDLARLRIELLQERQALREDELAKVQRMSEEQARALAKLELEKRELLKKAETEARRQEEALAAAVAEAHRKEIEISALLREKEALEQRSVERLNDHQLALQKARKAADSRLEEVALLKQQKERLEQNSRELSQSQQQALDAAIAEANTKAKEVEAIRAELERQKQSVRREAAANAAALSRITSEASRNDALIARLEGEAGQSVVPVSDGQSGSSMAAPALEAFDVASANPGSLLDQVEELEKAVAQREAEANKLIRRLENAKKARVEADMDVAALPDNVLEEYRKERAAANASPLEGLNLIIDQDDPDFYLTVKGLARRLQEELNRAGCNAGTVDGVWGRNSRSALKRLLNVRELKIAAYEPSPQLLALAKGHPDKACKLTCKPGFVVRGGECVRPIRRKQSACLKRAFYLTHLKCPK